MKSPNYYHAMPSFGGFRGRIYTYSDDGNLTIQEWISTIEYAAAEAAEDAAIDWADANGAEVERE